MNFRSEWRNGAENWALVTGAASGIGLAFARHLGALGYNLALADIDIENLHKAATELHSKHAVRVLSMCVDLARHESAGRLHDWCEENEIRPVIVVNNAGIFDYCDVLKTDHERLQLFVGLHVTTPTMICRLFGEDMAARGKGHILNMSSYAAWMPWPGIAMYSATKGYLHNFSRALAAELREKGVIVTTALPAGVTTGLYGLSEKWQRIGRRAGVLLTPETTAGGALRAMFRGRKRHVPGALMRAVLPLVRVLPARIIRYARKKTQKFRK